MGRTFLQTFSRRSGIYLAYVMGLLAVILLLSGCSDILTFLKKPFSKAPPGVISIELKRVSADIRQSEKLTGRLTANKDHDVAWYQVVIPAAGKLTCSLTQLSSHSQLVYGVYKSVRGSSLVETSVVGTQQKTITLDTQKGTHYVRVALQNGQTGAEYEIFLVYDRNGTAAGATLVSLNGHDPQGRLNGAQGDTLDWYRVNIKGSQKGTFTYYIQQQSEANLFVEFYRSSGKAGTLHSLAEERVVKKKGAELAYPIEAQPGETYYAKVFLKRSGERASYAIRNSFQPEEETAQTPAAFEDKPSPPVKDTPQPLPTPAPAQPETPAEQASEEQPITITEPSIWLYSVSPATRIHKDDTGNIVQVETTSDSLIIEGRATSPDEIARADIRIRCTKGCEVYQEEAADVPSPPAKDVNDLVILAPPPEPEPSQDEQMPGNVMAFSKKLLLQDGENTVRIDVVDSAGRTLTQLLTVVRSASGN